MDLATRIEDLFSRDTTEYGDEFDDAFAQLKMELNNGTVRAAERDHLAPSGWKVNAWVKKGILLGFRIGQITDMSMDGFVFCDKHTFPLKTKLSQNTRVVPGGSAIRDGCFIGKNVTCMPPMYINVGAYVDEGTLVDSHALVGSCAQIGKRCHVSAAAQVGGVLEPVGALPVIIEDEVLVGGNCGVYDGAIIGERAVLAAGTILTGSVPIYDLVRESVYRRSEDRPLMVPPGAVVVPGTRALTGARGREWGLAISTPVIVKYRDDQTDQAARLEEWLR